MMKMVELIVNKPSVTYNLDDTANITFTINKNNLNAIDSIKTDKLTLIVKEYRLKRSLSQNAYMWVLLNKLAEKLGDKAENIYKHFIEDYGVRDYILVQDQAVDELQARWEKKGIGWFSKILRKGKIDGTTTIIVYYGSSSYNSLEMARVINAVIEECENNEIPTLTEKEFLSLQNEND